MKNTVRQLRLKIKSVKKIKRDVFLISFFSPYLVRVSSPGNFLHLKISGVILRRPFSIHRVESDKVFVLFKVKGRGTKALASYKKEMVLDVIGPLGRGFRLPKPTEKNKCNILVAGGIGVAPLAFLAEKLSEIQNPKSKIQNLVLLGAKNKNEILCENDFKRLGYRVLIATEDGSKGYKGTVTQLLKDIVRDGRYEVRTTVYACGPAEMFAAISRLIGNKPNIGCQVSFEQFMGCGLGVCSACVIKTKDGYKKVCRDGPVFDIKDIW